MPSNPIYPDQKYTTRQLEEGCAGDLHPKALLGLQLFNSGKYFEAHEELELAWRDEPGPVREVYRGILQVGVAYYHILNRNYPGAVKMFKRAWSWLKPYPNQCRGIDLARFLTDARRVETEIISLGAERLAQFDPGLLKPVLFTSNPEESQHEA